MHIFPLSSKYEHAKQFLTVCCKLAELGIKLAWNISKFYQFVFPEGGSAGPRHVEEWNKLVCPNFI
jgi:hypothetical protein